MTRPPRQEGTKQGIFRLLRLFSVSGLVGMLAAILLLTLLYRQVAVATLIQTGERGSQALAQSFLNAVRTPLMDYLVDEDHHHGRAIPAELALAIAGLRMDTGVTRVMICDDEGIVLYSSQPDRIGTDLHGQPGFQGGLVGRVSSELGYRDWLNPFDRRGPSDNLIQTYIPIRPAAGEPALGVLIIQSDTGPLVAGIERAELAIVAGSAITLGLLYIALLAILRRAAGVIAAQQHTIRERNHALEVLSTQLITAQEDEKKRLAVELHEGVAQILSSIKYQMENACRVDGQPCPLDKRPLDAIVPVIQDTIQDVRALAMDLRPASLDELGLIPTLNWYCREFRTVHPDIELRFEHGVGEGDIPKTLKVVLFRLSQQMLQYIARLDRAGLVTMSLHKTGDRVRLEVTEDGPTGSMDHEQAAARELHLLTLRERVTLAGGEIEVATAADGDGTLVRATWLVQPDDVAIPDTGPERL
ncbi:MAG: hypothetical protein HGA75_15210 [Thiobacillus sp.]|nr:hypothetical protein [Thiobacillus sp.]